MPAAVIKSFAEKSGKSEKEVESLYQQAKKQVEKEYNLTEKDGGRYYALITGILKKMCKIKDAMAICGKCSNLVTDQMAFCPHCGSKFSSK